MKLHKLLKIVSVTVLLSGSVAAMAGSERADCLNGYSVYGNPDILISFVVYGDGGGSTDGAIYRGAEVPTWNRHIIKYLPAGLNGITRHYCLVPNKNITIAASDIGHEVAHSYCTISYQELSGIGLAGKHIKGAFHSGHWHCPQFTVE